MREKVLTYRDLGELYRQTFPRTGPIHPDTPLSPPEWVEDLIATFPPANGGERNIYSFILLLYLGDLVLTLGPIQPVVIGFDLRTQMSEMGIFTGDAVDWQWSASDGWTPIEEVIGFR